MGKNRKFYLALGVILIISIIIVWFNPFKFLMEDNFYLGHGGLNFSRFPLIKPYEAIYISEDYGWEIGLHGYSKEEFLFSILRVESISVMDGTIAVYSSKPDDNKIYNTETKKYKWFVIIPNENIEIGFTNEIDFLNYLKNYGITGVKWQEPNRIWSKFDWTWCLEWIPVCK
jgi:hypothetical protein